MRLDRVRVAGEPIAPSVAVDDAISESRSFVARAVGIARRAKPKRDVRRSIRTPRAARSSARDPGFVEEESAPGVNIPLISSDDEAAE